MRVDVQVIHLNLEVCERKVVASFLQPYDLNVVP